MKYKLLTLSFAFLFAINANAAATTLLKGSTAAIPASGPSGTPILTTAALSSADLNSSMDFEVVLKLPNFGALQALLATKTRPTPGVVQSAYLPAQSDYTNVVTWLKSQGFTVTKTDPNRIAVFATGSVSQLTKAFQLKFGKVSFNGATSVAAVIDPSVPTSLVPILGVNGLQPALKHQKHVVKGPPVRQAANATGSTTTFIPSQLATAYNMPSGSNGSGQTTAIVIDTFPLTSDLTAFWQQTNTPQSLSNIAFVQIIPGTLAAPSGEETLDTEWTSSIAPASKVRVYATLDLSYAHIDEAYQQILADAQTDATLRQVSLSYGSPEQFTPVAQMQTDDQYFALMAAAGITTVVASGDGGSNPSPSDGSYNGFLPVETESPANDPYVTSVGGTSITLSAINTLSTEVVWNDIFIIFGNAGGGGVSSTFGLPAWQKAPGVPANASGRCVPDIASPADPNTGGLIILNGQTTPVGGTSWGAPVWAAYAACINQARAGAGLPSIGDLAPNLYPLAGTSSFHDTTSGINGNWDAGKGYDLCTGLGTPNLTNLITALAGASSGVLPNQTDTIASGSNATLTMSNPPSGASYSWTLNGAALAGATSSSFSLPNASVLQSGTYVVSATSGKVTTTQTFIVNITQNGSFGSIVTTGAVPISTALNIQGTTSVTLLVRALGPTAATLGTPNAVANPSVAIYDSNNNLRASNTGWTDPNCILAANLCGAAPLPAGSADSAFTITVPPGTYSIQCTAVGLSGNALVEIYEVP